MPDSGRSISPDITQCDFNRGFRKNALFERLRLTKENQRLKEKLLQAEESLQIKDETIRELTGIQNGVKKLYSTSKQVLRAMTDNNDNDAMSDPNHLQEVTAQAIDELCEDLQQKLSDWQDKHQLLHDQLEAVLLEIDEFADMLSPSPSPPNTIIHAGREDEMSSDGIDRRDPAPSLTPPREQSEPSRFPCEHCGVLYSRLGHVCAKLEFLRSLGLVPMNQGQAGSLAVESQSRASSSMERNRPLPKHVKKGKSSSTHLITPRSQSNPTQFRRASSSKGRKRPLAKYAKKGRKSSAKPLITPRLPSNPNRNRVKCGFCTEDYDRRLGMKDHLRIMHGVEYRRGLYHCLECGEEFPKNKGVVGHHHNHRRG